MVKKEKKGHKHQDSLVKKLQKYFKAATVSNQNAQKTIVSVLPKVEIFLNRTSMQ
jgi:hypothetical protein